MRRKGARTLCKRRRPADFSTTPSLGAVTNTINMGPERLFPQLTVLSVANLLGEALGSQLRGFIALHWQPAARVHRPALQAAAQQAAEGSQPAATR